MTGIYCILNPTNGKRYIGSSVHIEQRWAAHKSALKLNKHDNMFLQSSYNKYGEFLWEIIEECEQEKLLDRENHYINLYKTLNSEFGYNLKPAEKQNKDYHKAYGHISRAVQAFKNGEFVTEFANVRVAADYFNVSPQTIRRWCLNGTSHARKYKQLYSYRFKFKDSAMVNTDRTRAIDVYEKGKIIATYYSVVDCARAFDICTQAISRALHGHRKKPHKIENYEFKYGEV